MICISIAQESRRLALADMLNTARQCDLLEVRLDRFGKAPDVGGLLAVKPTPVIMSCRQPRPRCGPPARPGAEMSFRAIRGAVHNHSRCPDRVRRSQHSPRLSEIAHDRNGLDLAAQPSSLLREAQTRGCLVVMPRQVWLESVALQTHLLTSKEVPRQLLEDAVPWLREED